MPGRYTGTVGKSFSGDRDKARSRQGAAQVLVQSLVDRIKNSPMKGRGLLTGKKYLADGSTVWAMVNMIGIVPIVRTWVDAPVSVSVGSVEEIQVLPIVFFSHNLYHDWADTSSLRVIKLAKPSLADNIFSRSEGNVEYIEVITGYPFTTKHADVRQVPYGQVVFAYNGTQFISKLYEWSDPFSDDGSVTVSSSADGPTIPSDAYFNCVDRIAVYNKYPTTEETELHPVAETPSISLKFYASLGGNPLGYDIINVYDGISGRAAFLSDENPSAWSTELVYDVYTSPFASINGIYSLSVAHTVTTHTGIGSHGHFVDVSEEDEGEPVFEWVDPTPSTLEYYSLSIRRYSNTGELVFNKSIVDIINDTGFTLPTNMYTPEQWFDQYIAASLEHANKYTDNYGYTNVWADGYWDSKQGVAAAYGAGYNKIRHYGSNYFCCYGSSLYAVFGCCDSSIAFPTPPNPERPKTVSTRFIICRFDETETGLTLLWQFEMPAIMFPATSGNYFYEPETPVSVADLYTDNGIIFGKCMAANSTHFAFMKYALFVAGDAKTGNVIYTTENPFGINTSVRSMAFYAGKLWIMLNPEWKPIKDLSVDACKLVIIDPAMWISGEIGVVKEYPQADIKKYVDESIGTLYTPSDFQAASCLLLQNPKGGDA